MEVSQNNNDVTIRKLIMNLIQFEVKQPLYKFWLLCNEVRSIFMPYMFTCGEWDVQDMMVCCLATPQIPTTSVKDQGCWGDCTEVVRGATVLTLVSHTGLEHVCMGQTEAEKRIK